MNRREFLRRALSLAPAAIIVPPAVTYILAPRGGWPTSLHSSTMAFYVREYAKVLNRLVNPPLLAGTYQRYEGIDFVVPRAIWDREMAEARYGRSPADAANEQLARLFYKTLPPQRRWFDLGRA